MAILINLQIRTLKKLPQWRKISYDTKYSSAVHIWIPNQCHIMLHNWKWKELCVYDGCRFATEENTTRMKIIQMREKNANLLSWTMVIYLQLQEQLLVSNESWSTLHVEQLEKFVNLSMLDLQLKPLLANILVPKHCTPCCTTGK